MHIHAFGPGPGPGPGPPPTTLPRVRLPNDSRTSTNRLETYQNLVIDICEYPYYVLIVDLDVFHNV